MEINELIAVTIILFSALLTVVPQVSAIRCYICGPVSPIDVTRRNIPTSKSTTPHSLNDLVTGPCDQFDTDIANRVHFERECPAEYQGCATQIEGIDNDNNFLIGFPATGSD